MLGRHEIPTKLEVEDKVVFGMTARQLLFLGMGIAVGYLLYQRASAITSPHAGHLNWTILVPMVLGFMPVGITLALAFIRPADRPLETWAMALIHYRNLPKRCIWRPLTSEPTPDEQTEEALLAELDLTPIGHAEPETLDTQIGLGNTRTYAEMMHG